MQRMQADDFDSEECIAEVDPEELGRSPSPVSQLQELTQSVAASISPITAAAPSRAAQWKDMHDAQARAQKRLDELVRSDTELSRITNEHYGMRFEAASFMKAKPGASKVYEAIIDHILTRSGAEKSQTQIRSFVAERYTSHTMPKDWTKPIPAWAVTKVKQRIQNSAVPISNIQVPKAVTLSQLHAAARAAMERHKTGAQTFKPLVQVSDTSVVINGIAFPISNNIVKGEAYKQVRASMLKLHKALELGK